MLFSRNNILIRGIKFADFEGIERHKYQKRITLYIKSIFYQTEIQLPKTNYNKKNQKSYKMLQVRIQIRERGSDVIWEKSLN